MPLEIIPFEITRLGDCGCLADVRWEEGVGNMVAMHTGPVNAAKNCDHCDGSGLDQNRLIGALTAKLPPHTVIYGNKAEWAIYFLCGGERRIAAGGALLEALLEVYRIMHSPPVSVEWS